MCVLFFFTGYNAMKELLLNSRRCPSQIEKQNKQQQQQQRNKETNKNQGKRPLTCGHQTLHSIIWALAQKPKFLALRKLHN